VRGNGRRLGMMRGRVFLSTGMFTFLHGFIQLCLLRLAMPASIADNSSSMTCEKQFVPRDDKFLYCSEAYVDTGSATTPHKNLPANWVYRCRKVDQNSSSHGVSVRNYNDGSYSISAGSHPEPKDIIPRASPSRPNSMLFNSSPPASPGALYDQHRQHSSAITALRSLHVRPPSPPSPSGGSSIWPFSRSPIQTPSTSYSRPSAAFFSSTYDVGMGSNNAYTHDMGPRSMDRPLPSRRPGSDARPRSIELVTPMIGR
jgi:hypothetical protein